MEDLALDLLKDPRAQLAAILWLVLETRRLRSRVAALITGHVAQEKRIEALEVRTKLRRAPVGPRV